MPGPSEHDRDRCADGSGQHTLRMAVHGEEDERGEDNGGCQDPGRDGQGRQQAPWSR